MTDTDTHLAIGNLTGKKMREEVDVLGGIGIVSTLLDLNNLTRPSCGCPSHHNAQGPEMGSCITPPLNIHRIHEPRNP